MSTPKKSRPTMEHLSPDHAASAGPHSPASHGNHADTLSHIAGGGQLPRSAHIATSPDDDLPIVDPLLFVHATAHHDLEQQRIASENRLRILTTTQPDDDGVMRGFGLDDAHPDVARLRGITDALRSLEHDAELGLGRALRRGSIYPWVKAQVGLGDKQVARLLASIGDPYWHLVEDRPRTVSELWAYSGLHVLPASHNDHETHGIHAGGDQTSNPGQRSDAAHRETAGVAARRRKGQRSNWSTDAKTRAFLCATSCIKQERSPYRAVYLTRRSRTAETHPEWSAGHSHADGLRIASKAILRDLWREARRLHGVIDDEQAISA